MDRPKNNMAAGLAAMVVPTALLVVGNLLILAAAVAVVKLVWNAL